VLAGTPDLLEVGAASSLPSSSASSMSISLYPIIAFMGVRSSWLIFARKEPLALFACSAASWACRTFLSTRLVPAAVKTSSPRVTSPRARNRIISDWRKFASAADRPW
jgi:hypothetical protein